MIKKFIYSEEQKLFRINFDGRLGKTYKPGKVKIDGRWREFTDMCDLNISSRYKDAIVVGTGDVLKLDIVNPTFVFTNPYGGEQNDHYRTSKSM